METECIVRHARIGVPEWDFEGDTKTGGSHGGAMERRVLTDALGIGGLDGASTRPTLVVVAGNPGVIHFYDLFLRALWLQGHGHYDVVGLSHAGHCGKPSHPKPHVDGETDDGDERKHIDHELMHRSYTLEDQVQHKLRFLQALGAGEFDELLLGREAAPIVASNTREAQRKVVLLGHSIGSYICLRIAETAMRHDETTCLQWRIVQTVNLMPTFRNLYEGLAPPVKVCIQPVVRDVVSLTLHYVPMWLRAILLTFAHHLTSEARYIVSTRLTYGLVHNVLSMAYEESQVITDIDSRVDYALKTLTEEEILFIYSKTDRYTPLSFITDLISQYDNVKGSVFIAEDGVEHAFVLKTPVAVAKQLGEVGLFERLKAMK